MGISLISNSINMSINYLLLLLARRTLHSAVFMSVTSAYCIYCVFAPIQISVILLHSRGNAFFVVDILNNHIHHKLGKLLISYRYSCFFSIKCVWQFFSASRKDWFKILSLSIKVDTKSRWHQIKLGLNNNNSRTFLLNEFITLILL